MGQSMLALTGQELDLWALVLQSRGVVMVVLVMLALFSVASWYIIAYKYFALRRAHAKSQQFTTIFWNSKRLDAIYKAAEEHLGSPIAQVFRAGYVELSKLKSDKRGESERRGEGEADSWLGDMQSIERALERARTAELTHLESMIPFLATTGSAAPFVGLFGTVWGIMNSFRNIGLQKSAGLSTVAPGIAEALVATAIGLMAAIPAVVAYNYFTRRVKVQAAEMETFASDFLNIVKRHFFK